ncbi:MAG: hypothetical protein NC350_00695 [Corallococcus sp.]|nr:hypothetical protein [Corallococcus sp.]
MELLKRILELSDRYRLIALCCAGAFSLLFAAANIFRNAYGKTDRQIKRSESKLKDCIKIGNFASFGNSVATSYKQQWEIYCESSDKKPSEIMRFVNVKQRTRWVAASVLSGVIACWYTFVYFVFSARVEYIVAPVVWMLVTTWSVIIAKFSARQKQCRAIKIFTEYVEMLDICFGTCGIVKRAEDKRQTSELADKIRAVRTYGNGEEALKRVAKLLKDADGERTCLQQKSVNRALNDLILRVTSDSAFC